LLYLVDKFRILTICLHQY